MGFFRKPQSCSSESKKSQHGDEPEPQNIQPDATHDPKLQWTSDTNPYHYSLAQPSHSRLQSQATASEASFRPAARKKAIDSDAGSSSFFSRSIPEFLTRKKRRSPSPVKEMLPATVKKEDKFTGPVHLEEFKAGFWRQFFILVWKDLLTFKSKWLLEILAFLALVGVTVGSLFAITNEGGLNEFYRDDVDPDARRDLLSQSDNASWINKGAPDTTDAQVAFSAFGMLITIVIGYHQFQICNDLVIEKRRRLRCCLYRNRLLDAAYYCALFLKVLCGAVLTGLIGAVCAIPFFDSQNYNCGWSFVYRFGLTMFVAHLCFIYWGIAFSAMFTASWAPKISCIFFVLLNLLPFIANVPQMHLGIGGHWRWLPSKFVIEMLNALRAPKDNNQFWEPFIYASIYSAAEFVVYLYLDQVVRHFSDDHSRPWYFLFTLHFWRDVFGLNRPRVEPDDERHGIDSNPSYLEFITDNHLLNLIKMRRVVAVKDLSVKYKLKDGSYLHAVDNFNLTMFEGEVFCLMGQSGCGKSTAISAISGLSRPNNGLVSCFGREVKACVPPSFGMSAQRDTLWPHLTVAQHLKLFAAVKGVKKPELDRQRLLNDLGIDQYKNTLAKHLNAVNRRRLCIAIAFVGNPKFVILDEPTRGMDRFAKREIWDFLRRKRAGRVILVSTNCVDEADAIADRAGIMSQGQLAAVGGTEFLKKKFGCGYVLSMKLYYDRDVPVANQALQELAQEYLGPLGLDRDVNKNMSSSFEQRNSLSSSGFESPDESENSNSKKSREVSICLGFHARQYLPDILRTINEWKKLDRIESYAINVATLRDAFLNASRLGVGDQSLFAPHSVPEMIKQKMPEKAPSAFSQILPMLYRRFLLASRQRLIFAYSWLGPTAITVGAFAGYSYWIGKFTPMYNNNQTVLPAVITALCINCAFAALSLFSTDFLVRERALLIKQQMILSGCSKFAYWTSNLLYDFLLALLPALVMLLISGIFRAAGTSVFQADITMGDWPQLTIVMIGYALGHALVSFFVSLLTTKRWVAACTTVASAFVAFLAGLFVCLYAVSLHGNSIYTAFNIMGNVFGSFTPMFPLMTFIMFPGFRSGHAQDISPYVVAQLSKMSADPSSLGIIPKTYFAPLLKSILPSLFSFSWTIDGAIEAVQQNFVLENDLIVGSPARDELSIHFDVQTELTSVFNQTNPTVAESLAADNDFIDAVYDLGNRMVAGYQLIRLAALVLLLFIVCVTTEIVSSSVWWWKKRAVYEDVPEHALGPKDSCVRKENERIEQIGNQIAKATGQPLPSVERDRDPEGWNEWFGSDLEHDIELKSCAGPSDSHIEMSDFHDHECCENGHAKIPETSNDADFVHPPIFCQKVRRVFKGNKLTDNIHAVRDVSFAGHNKEVFGFLGEHGAGKTSAFEMFAGLAAPSGGTLMIKGRQVGTDMTNLHRHVGYVPSHNAIWDHLTPRETLQIYARIRGLHGEGATEAVRQVLLELQLDECTDSLCSTLSDGAKRKLAWGIGIIGQPDILLFDDPTRGMDPENRRFMGNLIRKMAEERSDGMVVISTNVAEEAAMLCDRVAITVDGSLRCLNTPQHIKGQHAQGFELNISFCPPPQHGHELTDGSLRRDPRDVVALWVAQQSILIERKLTKLTQGRLIRAEVNSLSATWILHVPIGIVSECFEKMEGIKSECNVTNFHITQVTLERVFYYFSAQKVSFDYDV